MASKKKPAPKKLDAEKVVPKSTTDEALELLEANIRAKHNKRVEQSKSFLTYFNSMVRKDGDE